MKHKRYTEEKIVSILKEHEAGADSSYKGPLCQERNRRSELKPGR